MMLDSTTVNPLRRNTSQNWRPRDLAEFPLGLRMTQVALERLGTLAPEVSARVAHTMYFTPRRHRRPLREKAWLKGSEPVLVRTPYGDVTAHTWGGSIFPWETRGRPNTVLLMHGWEGRGSQLGAFVEPLTAQGYRVVALDGPAHGDSAGTRTDLLQFSDAIQAAAQQLGPLHAVIAHSMGAGATLLALDEGLSAERVVLVAPPARLSDVADRFASTLRLPAATVTQFRKMIEADFGPDIWTRVNVERMAEGFMARALVVHDVDDTDIPFSDGLEVARAWPGARMVSTAGLGHSRILRDGPVVEEVVRFVTSPDV